jgi:hypothetical protein
MFSKSYIVVFSLNLKFSWMSEAEEVEVVSVDRLNPHLGLAVAVLGTTPCCRHPPLAAVASSSAAAVVPFSVAAAVSFSAESSS